MTTPTDDNTAFDASSYAIVSPRTFEQLQIGEAQVEDIQYRPEREYQGGYDPGRYKEVTEESFLGLARHTL